MPLAVALGLLLGIPITAFYWHQRQNLENSVRAGLVGFREAFDRSIVGTAERLNGLLDLLEKDPELRKAWLAKDRVKLLRHATPLFENVLSKYRVTHFYFFGTDKICFLRVHNPKRYGDRGKCYALDEAEREGKTAYGIELGPFGILALRLTHPWRIGGKLVGYIELAEDVDCMMHEVSKTLGAELILTLDKQHLNRKKWEEGMAIIGRPANWDQLPGSVIAGQTIHTIPSNLLNYMKLPHQEHRKIVFRTFLADRSYRGGFLPVFDAEGIQVADAILLKDVTEQEASLWSLSVMLIGLGVFIGAVLIGLFYFYLHKIEFRLVRARDDLMAEIKEHKTTAAALVRAKEDAELANASKNVFLANVSHEIRTPLAAVLGFSELLMNSGQSERERVECARAVQRNGATLLRLINDLLDLSKAEAGRLEIEKVKFNLSDLLAELASSFHEQAKRKGLGFTVKRDGPLPEMVESDPTRLRQMLTNVVGNAIKFTEMGGIEVGIHGKEQSQDGLSVLLGFTISDTGIGVSESDQRRLFESFSQGDSSTKRRFGGTGLGLALSRKLARNMGGDLVLRESVSGKGATFELTLLVSRAEVLFVSKGGAVIDSVVRSWRDFDLKGKKILLVEDSPDNQLLIKTFLQESGVLVDTANDGIEGVRKALEHEFDMILMDVQMPHMDGFEATNTLRQKGFRRPIVAVTAHAMVDECERCIEAGCNGYLTKPVSRAELIRTVYELAGSS